jgi:hypothetical protein
MPVSLSQEYLRVEELSPEDALTTKVSMVLWTLEKFPFERLRKGWFCIINGGV